MGGKSGSMDGEEAAGDKTVKGATPITSFYDFELDAMLQFGSREMLLGEALMLGAGTVVELNRRVSDPVDLVVGDRIVARGEVVIAAGGLALRITEVAAPKLRLESVRCLF